jgi:hypothetical protein
MLVRLPEFRPRRWTVIGAAAIVSGPAGQKVTLTGSGFYAHENVRLTVNGLRPLGHVVISAAGSFTAPVTVPQLAPGRYRLYANGQRGFTNAWAEFTVTG